MTITPGAILLGIALLILVLLFVARPFLLRRAQEAASTTREALQAQKEAYMGQIADLDFDHETGKVPHNIYEQERRQLLIQAALILRQLDTLGNGRNAHAQPTAPDAATQSVVIQSVEAQIEQAILELRQQRSTSARPTPTPNGGSQAYCPHCARPVKPSDNFCRSCGHSLRQET